MGSIPKSLISGKFVFSLTDFGNYFWDLFLEIYLMAYAIIGLFTSQVFPKEYSLDNGTSDVHLEPVGYYTWKWFHPNFSMELFWDPLVRLNSIMVCKT